MAARRRIFCVFYYESKEAESVVMAVASSLKQAKELAVEAWKQMNEIYPMPTEVPEDWYDDGEVSVASTNWFIEHHWLNEVVQGGPK